MRILLAEDEPLTRHLVTRLLEEWGYQVEVASDGLEALERLQAEVEDPGVDADR